MGADGRHDRHSPAGGIPISISQYESASAVAEYYHSNQITERNAQIGRSVPFSRVHFQAPSNLRRSNSWPR